MKNKRHWRPELCKGLGAKICSECRRKTSKTDQVYGKIRTHKSGRQTCLKFIQN
jgi:hypothetical protein